MSHYVLITGGRDPDESVWEDLYTILTLLKGLHGSELRVMHGAARGTDSWAGEVCDQLGIISKGYPADWERDSKRAGLQRNMEMLTKLVSWIALGHTAQVVAFPGGTGTAHCVTNAEKLGLDVSHIVATAA